MLCVFTSMILLATVPCNISSLVVPRQLSDGSIAKQLSGSSLCGEFVFGVSFCLMVMTFASKILTGVCGFDPPSLSVPYSLLVGTSFEGVTCISMMFLWSYLGTWHWMLLSFGDSWICCSIIYFLINGIGSGSKLIIRKQKS